jgi:hypothetical protein
MRRKIGKNFSAIAGRLDSNVIREKGLVGSDKCQQYSGQVLIFFSFTATKEANRRTYRAT